MELQKLNTKTKGRNHEPVPLDLRHGPATLDMESSTKCALLHNIARPKVAQKCHLSTSDDVEEAKEPPRAESSTDTSSVLARGEDSVTLASLGGRSSITGGSSKTGGFSDPGDDTKGRVVIFWFILGSDTKRSIDYSTQG